MTAWVSRHQKVNHSGFNEARDGGVAVASAGPSANRLHLQTDKPRQYLTTQFFTGQMPFLLPNQQCHSTEDRLNLGTSKLKL